MSPLAGTVVLALCAAAGSWLDASSRRLPNWLCLVTAAAGFAFVAAEQGAAQLPWAGAHLVAALLVGMLLFRFGAIGGGDAKFYAACAAWFPIQKGLTLLISVSLAGLVLVMVWFAFLGFRRKREESGKGKFGLVPYGLAVAVGALATRLVA